MNDISSYIIKIWKKRYPNDTMYQFSKRLGIDQATLSRMFKAKGAFKQAQYLLQIADDLGVSIESLLTQKETPYDKDAEINLWKNKYFEAENRNVETAKKLKEVLGHIKKLES